MKNIRVIAHGGVGNHLISRIYVDTTVWALVKFAGRNWAIQDMEGHTYGHAKTREDGTERAKLMILAGDIPDPETAWRNNVGRTMKAKMEAAMNKCAPELFESMMRFIAAVKDNPEFARHPAFQVISAQVEAIIDTTVSGYVRARDHAMESAKTAHKVPLEQFGHSTRSENQRALDAFVKQEQARLDEADRRLLFAYDLAEEMKKPLRPLTRPTAVKKSVAA